MAFRLRKNRPSPSKTTKPPSSPSPGPTSPRNLKKTPTSHLIPTKPPPTLLYHINLLTTLTLKLLPFLFKGSLTWMVMLLRLILFVVFLMPGFVVFLWYYISVPIRGVKYWDEGGTRHLLDVYMPAIKAEDDGEGSGSGREGEEKRKPLSPVVVFITGGAWIIGYKAWGALLSRALTPHGILVIIPDYRNFPQTTAPGMLTDIDLSIQWVFDNCAKYGGDKNNVVLVGQSAGAWGGVVVCLFKGLKRGVFGWDSESESESEEEEKVTSASETRTTKMKTRTTWKPSHLRGIIPISGPYNLPSIATHFEKKGLNKDIISSIFHGDLSGFSPVCILNDLLTSNKDKDNKDKDDNESEDIDLVGVLPKNITIIHGSTDQSVPLTQATELSSTLTSVGISSKLMVYEDWSHTDGILEKPMSGDQLLHRDIYVCVREWYEYKEGEANGESEGEERGPFVFSEFDEGHPGCRRIVPDLLVKVARFFNPF